MSDQLFEHAVRDWLGDGSDRTPPAAIDAVLLAVRTTPQERDLRVPRRFTFMTTPMRLAAGFALVAILGLGALTFLNGIPGPGVDATPTPGSTTGPSPSTMPSPTAFVVNTSDWISYTSERYGFDIKRPPDWDEVPAERTWTFATDAADWTSPGQESFVGLAGDVLGPVDGLRVSAWAATVEAGTTLEAWLEGYCVANGASCPAPLDRAVPVSLDGRPGFLVLGPADVQAYFLVDNRVYVVAAWRPEARDALEAFLPTITLRPVGPVPDVSPPELTNSFTSAVHGYALSYPGAWAATTEESFDFFRAGPGTGALRVTSAALPQGADADEWIGQNLVSVGDECGPARSTLGTIDIDGIEARIRTSCGEVEATVVAGDRAYVFTLFVGDTLGDLDGVWTAGGRALFEAIVATIDLAPEDAAVSPSPGT